MKYKKIFVLFFCLILVGCNSKISSETMTEKSVEVKTETNKSENEGTKDDVTSINLVNEASKDGIEKEDGHANEGVNNNITQKEISEKVSVIQEKSKAEIMTNWDKEMMNKSKELGFVDIEVTVIEKIIRAQEKDILSYDARLKGAALFQSVVHKGFDQLKIIYETQTYNWTEFFGEYDYNLHEDERIVYLKGNNIHEAVVTDPMAKQYRYYREDHGIHYEVSELVMGSTADISEQDSEEWDVRKFGMCSYFDAFSEMHGPSYNPFLLEKGMLLVNCIITSMDEEPVIYIEKSLTTDDGYKLIKEWVSIKEGLVVKRESYNEKGVIEKIETVKEIVHEPIEDQIFYEPGDVEYKDLTFFIYLHEEEQLKDFPEAFVNTFVDEPFSMILTDVNTKEKLKLYSTGGEMKQVLIEGTASNAAGKNMKAYYFRDEAYFTTIIPELKLIEQYKSSVLDMKWFAFEALGFRGRRVEDEKAIYTFQDIGMGGVHDYYAFYDYVIDLENGKFIQINSYLKESIKGEEVEGYRKSYVLSDLKKERLEIFNHLNGYKELKYETHYDGEHPPSWWE